LEKFTQPLFGLDIATGELIPGPCDYDVSIQDWTEARIAAFEKLRRANVIPDELIDAVETADPHQPVEVALRSHNRPKSGLYIFTIKRTPNQAPKKSGRLRSQKMPKTCISASEALSLFLREALNDLRRAEGSRKAAPVRTLKLVPRSLIANLAMFLLESCDERNPPGPQLLQLFRDLLDVDLDRSNASEGLAKRRSAALIIAKYPNIGITQIARILSINPSTVSRWQRSADFRHMVMIAQSDPRKCQPSTPYEKHLSKFLSKSAAASLSGWSPNYRQTIREQMAVADHYGGVKTDRHRAG
jgi:hypothetical protein